jgi:hypothetical protein
MSDIVERLNAGLRLLDGNLHTLRSSGEMAVGLGLRDILTETRDEIDSLRHQVSAAYGMAIRKQEEIERLRGLLRRVVNEVPLWDEQIGAGELGNMIEAELAGTTDQPSAGPPYPVCYHGYVGGCPHCAADKPSAGG